MGTNFSDCCAAEALTLDGQKQKSDEYRLLAKAKAFEIDEDDINSALEGHDHSNATEKGTNKRESKRESILHNLKSPSTHQLKIENTTSNNQITNTMRLIKRKQINNMLRNKSAPAGAYEIQRGIDKIKHENDLFISKYGSYFSSTNTSSTNITTSDDDMDMDMEMEMDCGHGHGIPVQRLETDKTEVYPGKSLEMPLEIEDSFDCPVHEVIDTSLYEDQCDAEDMALINAVAAVDPNAVSPPQGPQPYKNTAAIFSNQMSSIFSNQWSSPNTSISKSNPIHSQKARYHAPPKGPVLRPMNGPVSGPNLSADSIPAPNGPKLSSRSKSTSKYWSPSLSMKSVSYTNNNEYENDEECHNVAGCKAIKRIIKALKWYSLSGCMENEHEIKNYREDVLLRRILNCGYDKHILDDYQHILNHHLIQCQMDIKSNGCKTEYELICDEIGKQIEPCDIKRCVGYKRFEQIVKKDLTQCNHQTFVIDFMDLIHCYLMHNQFL